MHENNIFKKIKKSPFFKAEIQGKPLTHDFIKYLKRVRTICLRSALIFTIIGVLLILVFNPGVTSQDWLINIFASILFGGLMGVYFFSPNPVIRLIGILMHAALLYAFFLPVIKWHIFRNAFTIFMYIGLVIFIYIVLRFTVLLFEELKKSGHLRKDWPRSRKGAGLFNEFRIRDENENREEKKK